MERTSKVEEDVKTALELFAENFRELRAFMSGAGFDSETAEELLQGVYRESLQEREECYKDRETFARNATKGFTKAILLP